MLTHFTSWLREALPWPLLYIYRKTRALPQDFSHIASFITHATTTPTRIRGRMWLVLKCYRISFSVDCPHMEHEMIQVMQAILNTEPHMEGVVVEAGAYKGGSSAKLSLAAALANRTLYIFDSFEGIPEHHEAHGKNIYGGDAHFPAGSYRGSREEVERAIRAYGRLDHCEFVQGWFENTMPHFKKPVTAAYVDVDLQSSTRTCVTHLYPLLTPRAPLFSQDGHLPLIIALLKDATFWKNVLHISPPPITGLGTQKLVKITKPT